MKQAKQYKTVLTKRQANAAILESLFHTGGTLACLPTIRFDRGKYRSNPAGRDMPQAYWGWPVWSEPRRDKDGPYWVLMMYRVSLAQPASA